jgi:sarcosine oxidase
MRRDADIVVVGAGIVGVATARALTESALSVILLERFEVGHAHGSSHGTSRIFRLNYPDERFVRLARAAREEWRVLEGERSIRLVEEVGVLDLGPQAAETARALAACGVPYETLSAADVTARWPLRLGPDETATYQRDGGFLYADRAYEALLSAALGDGVELRERTTVSALATGRGSVRLTLENGELTARAVVVTAGAWAPGLLEGVGIDLPVVPTRETVVYLGLESSERVPPVIDYAGTAATGEGGVSRVGSAAYALPAPGRGVKAGLHHSGPVADPDDDPVTDEAAADWVAAWAAGRYAGLGEAQATETCLYTNTADESFVLERRGRIVVGSACSGHGFKFAPVVGRTLAALAREAVG